MSSSELSTHAGLQTVDYAVIVLYMVITFGIAVWFGRKQKDTDDFFVGGRRMPWFAVGLSILATLFSTLSYLGAPGEMIKNGVGLFVGNFAVPFSMAVVFFLWIPFFMRLNVTSAYEYLERRFSYGVRLIGAVLFILLRLGWMSVVVFAASMALDAVQGAGQVDGQAATFLGLPYIYWWILGVGLFASIYTSVGGIQAMIWTDVLQCVLLMSGVLLAIFYVVLVDGTGPFDWWATASTIQSQNAAQKHTDIPWFSFDVTVRNTVFFAVVGNFFWTISTHGSDQVVLQRYFSTASQKEARRSYIINVCVDLTMSVLLGLAGLALLAFYLKHHSLLPPAYATANEAADKLFPHFLGHQLPVGCAGLIIAAFICDAMQTLESGVNSVTAVVTNDIVPRLRQGRPRILSELTFVRLLTIAITAVVTANACLVASKSDLGKYKPKPAVAAHKEPVEVAGGAKVASGMKVEPGLKGEPILKGQSTPNTPKKKSNNLVDMMPKFFNLFVGPLAGMFVVGMFISRATTRSVVPAVTLGLIVSVCWNWYLELFGTGDPNQRAPTPFLSTCVPWLTTVSSAFILSLIIERGTVHPGQNYTWYAIVRRRTSLPESEGSNP